MRGSCGHWVWKWGDGRSLFKADKLGFRVLHSIVWLIPIWIKGTAGVGLVSVWVEWGLSGVAKQSRDWRNEEKMSRGSALFRPFIFLQRRVLGLGSLEQGSEPDCFSGTSHVCGLFKNRWNQWWYKFDVPICFPNYGRGIKSTSKVGVFIFCTQLSSSRSSARE